MANHLVRQIDGMYDRCMQLLRVPLSRMSTAIQTWPDRRAWRDAALLMIVLAVIALPLGIVLGHLQFIWTDASPSEFAIFAGIAIVVPCFGEELLFRVFLVPHPQEVFPVWQRLGWSGLALLLFVAWHPLNGWLWKVSARSIFFDPAFLALAAVLGLICTIAYWRSGSIWPPLLIHWLALLFWKGCLGGRIIATGS